ncbi:MAG: hypothetical protein OEM67_02690 [Thermoleophilia bacterium]|nr:hypothetical protein [Thermoleophilia bacterium]MDH3724244.1 hypothetical protein [Thermoleophilia bacterium]
MIVDHEGLVTGQIDFEEEQDPDYRHASIDVQAPPPGGGGGVEGTSPAPTERGAMAF